MLNELYVDNYKCLVNFRLALKEVTLLLGPNGSGKSAVLDVISRLRRVLVEGCKVAHPDAFPMSSLTRWDVRDVQSFGLEVVLGDHRYQYLLQVEHQRPTGRARVLLEKLTDSHGTLFSCSLGEAQLYRDDHSEGPRLSVDWEESFLARVATGRDNRSLGRFMAFMRALLVCDLQPASFLAHSSLESTSLRGDGSDFVDWYRHVVQERTDLTLSLADELRDVIDGFKGIRMERTGTDTRTMQIAWVHGEQAYTLGFDEISDGQRMLIVLYGLIHLAGEQGFTLFLDEPDNYVALAEIQPWLMALVDACGQSQRQAVLCSHHPELIDYLGGDRGVLLERTDAGVTRQRDLTSEDMEGSLRLSERVARGWMV